MARPPRLIPWVVGYNDTLQEILDNQKLIIALLRAPGKGLSHEDRMVLEHAVGRLESLAAER